jgi:hypothetical protein
MVFHIGKIFCVIFGRFEIFTSNEPNANNCSQDPMQFIVHNSDLLERDGFRQTRENTMSMGAFEVKISNLPKITQKILPIWKTMRINKKYKCIICGKQRLPLGRYSEHMMFKHQVSLEDPNLDV